MSPMLARSCGYLVSLLLCRRCARVSGSGSVISSEICVRGQSFSIASTSETTVWSVVRLMWALPRVFLITVFVRPINLFQYPPNYGTFLGINVHLVPSRPSTVLSSSDVNSLVSFSAAEV